MAVEVPMQLSVCSKLTAAGKQIISSSHSWGSSDHFNVKLGIPTAITKQDVINCGLFSNLILQLRLLTELGLKRLRLSRNRNYLPQQVIIVK